MMAEINKKIIGLTEVVHVCGSKKCAKIAAICDTGATTTSIDATISKELDFGEPIGTITVMNPSVNKKFKREIVKVNLKIAGRKFEVGANVQDRTHMTHKMIIGRDILYDNFIVDVSRTHDGSNLKTIKDKELLKVKFYDK
ncbi:MAG: ATP-dependent zinc protease [Candidatus Aenigmarchaeota archaeon]|nr:ATP-dependent zinc protease [Candidatus Aenigmarchaeota archaeon]